MSRLSDFKNSSSYSRVSEEQIREKFDQYKDMSGQQLRQELFSEVARQKSSGSFDYNSLRSMGESLRGSVSEEQYKNMLELLENFK